MRQKRCDHPNARARQCRADGQTVAVVLDLVQPFPAGGRGVGCAVGMQGWKMGGAHRLAGLTINLGFHPVRADLPHTKAVKMLHNGYNANAVRQYQYEVGVHSTTIALHCEVARVSNDPMGLIDSRLAQKSERPRRCHDGANRIETPNLEKEDISREKMRDESSGVNARVEAP